MGDAVSTIIEAVTTGAAAGASSAANNAVQSGYTGLVGMVRRLFSRDSAQERELERVLSEPESDTTRFREYLSASDAPRDAALIEAAAAFLMLLRRQEEESRYRIQAETVQGVVQGDGNDVRMKF